MKTRTRKTLVVSLIALMLCALGISVPAPANAWYNWNDKAETVFDNLADLDFDSNGWQTTIASGAWASGSKAHTPPSPTESMTVVTTQEQSSLINNTELTLASGQAVQFTFRYDGGNDGFWITLATKQMFESGRRLNPNANEANGMPVSINFQLDGSGGWKVIYYEYNGFQVADTQGTTSGDSGTGEHTVSIYPGTEEDRSFVMIDSQVLYVPNLRLSTFEDGNSYKAYVNLYQRTNDATLKLSRPIVTEKPQMYAIELPAAKRADIGEGEDLTLVPVKNADLENEESAVYEWTSSDPGVATVDQSGNVTGLAEGSARITVTAKLNGEEIAKASCAVTTCAYNETGWLKNQTSTPWGIGVYAQPTVTGTDTTMRVGHSNEVWNREVIDLSEGYVCFDYTVEPASSTADWILFNLLTQAERQRGERVSNVNVSPMSFYTHNLNATPSKEKVVAGSGEETFPAPAEKKNRVVIYVGESTGDSWIAINGKKIGYQATLNDYKVTDASGAVTYPAYLHMFAALDAVNVTVSQVKTLQSAVFSNTDRLSMQVGESKTLDYTIETLKQSVPKATVTSSDPGVLTVGADGKTLTALKKGTAVVTVTADGYSVTCEVEVGDIAVEGITLSETGQIEMKVGETKELSFTVTPANYTEPLTVYWESAKTSRATVVVNANDQKKATVTAVSEGLVDITVEVNGITRSFTVNITAESDPVDPGNDPSDEEKGGCAGFGDLGFGGGLLAALGAIALSGAVLFFGRGKEEK